MRDFLSFSLLYREDFLFSLFESLLFFILCLRSSYPFKCAVNCSAFLIFKSVLSDEEGGHHLQCPVFFHFIVLWNSILSTCEGTFSVDWQFLAWVSFSFSCFTLDTALSDSSLCNGFTAFDIKLHKDQNFKGIVLSFITLVTQSQPHEGKWQVTRGFSGSPGRWPEGAGIQTDWCTMQIEFGYRVYFVGYEGVKGKRGRGEEREKEEGAGHLLASVEGAGWEWTRLVS